MHSPTPTPTNRPGIGAHNGNAFHEDFAAKRQRDRLMKAAVWLFWLSLALAVAVQVCGVSASETHRVAAERIPASEEGLR